MAKAIIKARISRNKTSFSTHYTYPAVWMANKQAIQVICYETFSPEGETDVVGRGNTDEFCYAYCDDTLIPTLTADPDIVQIDRLTAEAEIPKYIKQINQIKDENSVKTAIENLVPVLKKIARGEVVNLSEKQIVVDNVRVLDGDDTTVGINKSRGAKEILNDAGIV